ncbi:MAG: putative toxin-antitoxin system toxin component, PIN family, partial [Reyranella sp.]
LGRSRRLLELAFEDRLTLLASVALFLEYESVAFRPDIQALAALNKGEMTNFFTDLASAIEPVEIHFLWRPTLADAADEMVLEAAVNGQADIPATFNARHFAPAESAWMAAAVVEKIGSLSAAAFFQERGELSNAKRGLSILRRAGTQPPRPGDERG